MPPTPAVPPPEPPEPPPLLPQPKNADPATARPNTPTRILFRIVRVSL
jgi:hypothetical protein